MFQPTFIEGFTLKCGHRSMILTDESLYASPMFRSRVSYTGITSNLLILLWIPILSIIHQVFYYIEIFIFYWQLSSAWSNVKL